MENQESRSLVTVLWRRKWLIVATALVALAASVVVTLMRTPQYRAEALMVRDESSMDATLFGSGGYQSADDVQRDLVTAAQLLNSERVATLVKLETNSGLSTGQLLGMVSATPSTDSNTIKVQVVGSDPVEAAALADSFANQTILLRQEAQKVTLETARKALEAQIAMMTPTDLASSNGQSLQARVEQLRTLEQVKSGGYSLWQPARAPSSAISPRPARDIGAGFAVGLILGLVFAVAIDRLDRRLKDRADFERVFQLPILAAVPQVGRRWRRDEDNANGFVGFVNTGAPILEAFRLLRSNLQYFEVEKSLRSILIASGLPQEAKTATTTNLALSLALSGARVVLVDADLRNPLMDRYLHLDNRVGLSTVLAGTARVEDALQVVKIADFLPRQDRKTKEGKASKEVLDKDLLCLTAGPLPPNPAELLASPRMVEILKSLTAVSDHVLVDSAPLLLVADTVSLAPKVDGVILVSRAGSSTIDQAREIKSILERVGARMVGLVISGVRVRPSQGYKRGYYQKSD
jgi:Mrp family chromosome partitioning ATPase